MTARRRALAALGLCLLLVVAGCQGVRFPDDGPPEHGDRPDPEADVIGWEAGYWHNESIDVDQSDGLNDSELDAYVGRGMARVEVLRDREFRDTVPVSVISRDEYRNRSGAGGSDDRHAAWNNQVWEAMFVVGEDEDVQELLTSTYSESVLGFYSPGADEIKIITPTPDRPTVGNATLIHELTHALQDQYHDLGDGRFGGETQDGSLAARSPVEGEARHVEYRYLERCGESWACVASPRSNGGGGGGPPNWGISLTVYFPYSDGPPFVETLRDRGGWDAVDDAFESPPASTEQVIHATDDPPVEVTVADAARNGWSRFPRQGDGGADTLGEASIYVAFWYQSRTYDAGVVEPSSVLAGGRFDTYDYRSPPSAGWGGDAVVPYERNGSYGYVWKSRWDTEADAREFVRAYRDVLAAHDATRAGNGTWVVPDGPFADAFRVERSNATVVVTNAPTVADLADVRPPGGDVSDTPVENETTGIPGFGAPAALAATLLAALGAALAARRRGR